MHFIPAFIAVSTAALIAASPAPITIGTDDIILHGNGRYTIMKRSDLEELEAARNAAVVPPKPGQLDHTLFTLSGSETNISSDKLSKRGGDTIIVPNPKSRFLGWDILMSAVVKGAPTNVAVTSGHSISNSISVGVSAEFALIKDFLSASTSIDYGTTWESSQSQQFSADVPAGKFGAFVSNAWTNRESGNIWSGTIGESGDLTYYQADSFDDSENYGDLSWVDGVISLCTGDSLPLSRCLGEGTL
ncbi:hypothetical protein T440DRAFT_471890 [Plenodomus tracheiphilus IPT5]|uniref:Celp0028 effector like protein n=1 Tax=Plenodomus tracheiphilus IPT5 TaxID=1408161 RepID=A0A6A7AWE8_9PLEO|nr:hypothetical protein T440DRAFT_471890 [Plenodomus tracheiphilus IPT5]